MEHYGRRGGDWLGTIEPPRDEPSLELDTRRRIYERVHSMPGIHFRALQRELNIALGTLEYNLYRLEKEGLLVTREGGNRKAYFVKEGMDRRDRDVLAHLRQRAPRQVLTLIVDRPGITFTELREGLFLHASRLSTVMQRLREAGITEEERVGRHTAYRCIEGDRVRKLLVNYRESFLDELVDRFAETWMDL